MVKIGDTIFIKYMRQANAEHEPFVSLKRAYKVLEVYSNHVIILNNSGERYAIGVENYIPGQRKLPPKTEIEWLDRIKENFKE